MIRRSWLVLTTAVALSACGGPASPPADPTTAEPEGDRYQLGVELPDVVGRGCAVSIRDKNFKQMKSWVEGELDSASEHVTTHTFRAQRIPRELNADGKAVVIEYLVDKLTVEDEEGRRVLLSGGSLVTLTRSRNEDDVTIRGAKGEFDAATHAALDAVLPGKLLDIDDRDMLRLDVPRRIGEKWSVDEELLAKSMREATGMRLQQAHGSVLFVGLAKLGADDAYEIEAQLGGSLGDAKGLPEGMELRSGHLTFAMKNIDAVAATSCSSDGNMTMSLATEMTGVVAGKQLDVQVNVRAVREQTSRPVD